MGGTGTRLGGALRADLPGPRGISAAVHLVYHETRREPICDDPRLYLVDSEFVDVWPRHLM